MQQNLKSDPANPSRLQFMLERRAELVAEMKRTAPPGRRSVQVVRTTLDAKFPANPTVQQRLQALDTPGPSGR